MDEVLIVVDGDTREILSVEKFLNEHGLEKPKLIGNSQRNVDEGISVLEETEIFVAMGNSR